MGERRRGASADGGEEPSGASDCLKQGAFYFFRFVTFEGIRRGDVGEIGRGREPIFIDLRTDAQRIGRGSACDNRQGTEGVQ